MYKYLQLETDFLVKEFEKDIKNKVLIENREINQILDFFEKNYYGEERTKELIKKEFLDYLLD